MPEEGSHCICLSVIFKNLMVKIIKNYYSYVF